MKILAIRLKNLTSIEGSVEIDFTREPLRSAGIFAISGPTGAGKSTLLDALCLALYDQAPRFAASMDNGVNLTDVGEATVNQSDVRNLLRRGVVDGYAEVDFLGMTGCRYRSRWSVRRAHNRAEGALQPQHLQVKNLDTKEELQGRKKELLAQLTELVGLTYEQFTRTALLAQNDFATFLKAKNSAKAELLEKLTGTGIYSLISQEVFARNKAAAENVKLVRGQMDVIELLSDEAYRALLKEKEALATKRTVGTRQLALLNTQLTVVRSLKTQEELLQKKRLEEQAQEEKRKALLQALVVHEEGLARFKTQCEAIQPDLKRARQLDAQIQAQQAGYDQAQQSGEVARKQVAEQQKKYEAAETALQAAQQSLNSLLGKNPADHVTSGQIDALLEQEEENLATRQRENDDRQAQLTAFGYPTLMEQQGECCKEYDRLQAFRQLTVGCTQVKSQLEQALQESAIVNSQLAEKKSALDALLRVYDNARMAVGKDVQTLRKHLREEEPCPVCGSTAHPYCTQEKVVDTLYHTIEEEYNTAVADYQQINNRSVALIRDISHWQKQMEQYATQRLALRKDHEPENPDEAYFDHQLQACLKLGRDLNAKISEYNRLSTEWQRAEETVKKLRLRCRSLRDNVAQYRLLQQRVTAGAEQLTLLRNTEVTEQKRFQTLSQELDRLRRERSVLLKGKSVEDAELVMSRKEKELNLVLEQARKEAEAAQTCISGLQGEIRQLLTAIEELQTQKKDIVNADNLPEAIRAQEEENLATERRFTGIEGQLLIQEKNKETHRKLKQELAEKELISERWAKLNRLIGSADGAKFKVIAQGYTLNLLLMHANRHLSYLSRRYKLQQVPGTLALQVIDCDMCDEIRTVYSLSGGESFLISLALALGLSSLSSNNLKVESLFIDEGFGSLDAESLRTAMEALEQLQMQGRKIGVISHVQEMSERISVQVQVKKKANGKSEITVVG